MTGALARASAWSRSCGSIATKAGVPCDADDPLLCRAAQLAFEAERTRHARMRREPDVTVADVTALERRADRALRDLQAQATDRGAGPTRPSFRDRCEQSDATPLPSDYSDPAATQVAGELQRQRQ